MEQIKKHPKIFINILSAIEKGDCELAKKYATEHIEKAEQFMIDKAVSHKGL